MALREKVGRFAIGFASSLDPQFAKLATQVSVAENATFVRVLNDRTLQMRLSNPGISDLEIQDFQSQAHADRISTRTGIQGLTPLPQTRFAEQQTLQAETDIRTDAAVKVVNAREKAFQARPSSVKSKRDDISQARKSFDSAINRAKSEGKNPELILERLRENVSEKDYLEITNSTFEADIKSAIDAMRRMDPSDTENELALRDWLRRKWGLTHSTKLRSMGLDFEAPEDEAPEDGAWPIPLN